MKSSDTAPLIVVGLGLSGRAVVRLLTLLGWQLDRDFYTFDEKNPPRPGQTLAEFISEKKAKTLVVSPGVPLRSPAIQSFLAGGGKLTSELALAYDQLRGEKIIGVTGSLGKSTTVSLLGAALEAARVAHFVGGNIGRPLADYVADIIEKKRERAEWIVLELSSFQLENLGSLECEFSAITYLSSNHLERYASLQEYYETKWSLCARTRRALVFNKMGGDLFAFATKKAPTLAVEWASAAESRLPASFFDRAELIGAHNHDNIAVAAALGHLAEWPVDFLDGLLEFKGLPHRLQNVGVAAGVTYLNDSKATAIESVLTAVDSVLASPKFSQNITLLLGGRDKKLPWEKLSHLKAQARLRFKFFGECGADVKKRSGLEGDVFATLRAAMSGIKTSLKSGDVVLLSPGGTSLDEFKNFEDRGNSFAQMAREGFAG